MDEIVSIRRVEDDILLIFLNQPKKQNAVDSMIANRLYEEFLKFEADESLFVAVLAGVGSFCAGADLKAFVGPNRNVIVPVSKGNIAPMGPTRLVLTKPVIAAISGYCVAGGLELACWCDLRVMEESAVMGIFCRKYGVPLIDGGTFRLSRLIGQSRAMDLILTGRPVSAKEAFSIGLANRLCSNGSAVNEALLLAKGLCRFPQACMKADRLSLISNWDLSDTDALSAEYENAKSVIKDIKVTASTFSKKIKCVLFDLGGVVLDSPLVGLSQLSKSIGLDARTLNRVLGNSPAWKKLECGDGTELEFIQRFSKESSPFSQYGKEIINIVCNISPRLQMLAFIKSLKSAGYIVGIITNNFKLSNSLDPLKEIRSLFDIIVESCILKIRKPDPLIFTHVLECLNVSPRECLYFDDLPVNRDAARHVGMRTFLVPIKNWEVVIEQAKELLNTDGNYSYNKQKSAL